MISPQQVEDLRTMYSQWVDFVHELPPQQHDAELQRRVSDTIRSLMKFEGPVHD